MGLLLGLPLLLLLLLLLMLAVVVLQGRGQLPQSRGQEAPLPCRLLEPLLLIELAGHRHLA